MAPVASADSLTQPEAKPGPAIEVRHMYLFAPGKAPVKIVMREDGTSSEDREWVDQSWTAPSAEQ